MRSLGKEISSENLLHDRTHCRKRERLLGATSFGLEEVVRECREDHVVVPSWNCTVLKMIEPELRLEFLILLFDRPALMCKPCDFNEGCRWWEIDVEKPGLRT